MCVKELGLMTEPVTTSCGHVFCWPCIHLVSVFLNFNLNLSLIFNQWVEARKEAVTEDRETLEMARRCPSCRRAMVSLTPLFGFGVSRVEEDGEEIPRRPTESKPEPSTQCPKILLSLFYSVNDPFKSLMPPNTTPPPTTSSSVRRSGRQVVPNPRYNQFEEGEIFWHSNLFKEGLHNA